MVAFMASVATFGSFRDMRLFECTPVAVEVGLFFATRARVAWFVDGKLVRRDTWEEDGGDRGGDGQSSGLCCYVPTSADVRSGGGRAPCRAPQADAVARTGVADADATAEGRTETSLAHGEHYQVI